MTRKEKIKRMIERLPDDVTYDRVMYHLGVMRSVEIGLEQIERGEWIDHDELFAQLQAEDAETKNHLVLSGKRKPAKDSSVHRKGRAAHGGSVHKSPQKARRKALRLSRVGCAP